MLPIIEMISESKILFLFALSVYSALFLAYKLISSTFAFLLISSKFSDYMDMF